MKSFIFFLLAYVLSVQFDKVQVYDIKTSDDVIQRRAIREQLTGEEVAGQEKYFFNLLLHPLFLPRSPPSNFSLQAEQVGCQSGSSGGFRRSDVCRGQHASTGRRRNA